MKTKKCTKCGEEKELSEFYTNGKYMQSWCKNCCTKLNVSIRRKKRKCENFKKKEQEYAKVYSEKKRREILNKLSTKKNEFLDNKEKYSDKIINYKDSPTGKAYIGLAKEPLMENDNGIGFKGVKLQTENRELIQCYKCGEWFKQLGHHLRNSHNMSIREYKKKYGFFYGESLVSDARKNRAILQGIDNLEKARAKQRNGGYDNISKMRKNQSKLCYEGKNKIQYQNNKGTCPEQLKFNLINYINRFKRIPSETKQYSQVATLRRRFGTLNNALKEYGLPVRKQFKGLVEHLFSDNTTFYTKQGKGYRELYEIMKQKCPVLSEY